mmetsp:Transcript_115124/g.372453  ORF Transcript_115124/g.372453 Transcript_115124/m.372453 type:complete len:270 (+) Transcript_115124:33-842(+)
MQMSRRRPLAVEAESAAAAEALSVYPPRSLLGGLVDLLVAAPQPEVAGQPQALPQPRRRGPAVQREAHGDLGACGLVGHRHASEVPDFESGVLGKLRRGAREQSKQRRGIALAHQMVRRCVPVVVLHTGARTVLQKQEDQSATHDLEVRGLGAAGDVQRCLVAGLRPVVLGRPDIGGPQLRVSPRRQEHPRHGRVPKAHSPMQRSIAVDVDRPRRRRLGLQQGAGHKRMTLSGGMQQHRQTLPVATLWVGAGRKKSSHDVDTSLLGSKR